MDLKRSNGVPASALDRTWCNRVQLQSNARSKFECIPFRPVSRAGALAFIASNLAPWQLCVFNRRDHDRTHTSVRSNA
jgi:hypothetical protein